MRLTPSLYVLIARSCGVPLGAGRGSLSTAGATGLCRSTAAMSRTPIQSRLRCMRVSSLLHPHTGLASVGPPPNWVLRTADYCRASMARTVSSAQHPCAALALSQGLARLNQLRPGAIGLGTDGGELLEIPQRPSVVTGAFGRQAGTVQAAEAVRFLGDGGFVLRQGFGGPAKLQQHVSEEFTCWHERSRSHGVLLGLILMVGGGAHSGERLLLLALSEQNPGAGDLGLDLSLLSPVGQLALREHLVQSMQTLDLLTRSSCVAATCSTESPSKGVNRFGLRRTLPGLC